MARHNSKDQKAHKHTEHSIIYKFNSNTHFSFLCIPNASRSIPALGPANLSVILPENATLVKLYFSLIQR